MSYYPSSDPYRRDPRDPYSRTYAAAPQGYAPAPQGYAPAPSYSRPSAGRKQQGYDDYGYDQLTSQMATTSLGGSDSGPAFTTWSELKRIDRGFYDKICASSKAWDRLKIRPFRPAFPKIKESKSGSSSAYPSASGYNDGYGGGGGGGGRSSGHKCRYCSKVYDTRDQRERHEDKRHMCQFCQKMYPSETERNDHEARRCSRRR
ncbi:hypothetical protein QBC46DRAFT_345904 [Diplogelasinospora grovesii]|uniref:C2H2-type domain-containing protein n=1 Tax=Diplogelasinospora grovesii TaxID=303347 RepID=A0AAN6S004_9PEZI|nr:hypothetical protein QBC46DRAFT_345904 [Diplogelasinospora grovesii]